MLHSRCVVRSHPHADAIFVVQLPLRLPKGKGAPALEIKYGAEMIPYIIFLGTFHKMMDDFA
jgi:hypothetical protein